MASLNSMITSAPAKVILHGEHAVVYGKVALAASLGLRTTLKWEKLNEDRVALYLDDLGFSASWTIAQLENLPSFPKGMEDFSQTEDYVPLFKTFLYEMETDISETAFTAALAFIYLYKAIYGKTGSLMGGKFFVKSDVPVGAGLGSSASYSVVVATSLLVTAGAVCPKSILEITTPSSCGNESSADSLKLINKWAYEGEKIMHGNPSGIDNTMSTFGGFLQFQSGKMENIERVPELNILLVNTNIPRSTKEMVSGLKKRYEEMPCVYESLFTAMGAMTIECIQVLGCLSEQNGSQISSSKEANERMDSFQKLEKLIDLNQDLLRVVGVSHPTVDKVCEKTLEYGFHSKLTGAGGGGCVVTLIKKDVQLDVMNKLCEELKNLGCNSWNTKLGGSGVLLHEWR